MNGSVCFALQAHCSLLDCTQESTPVSTFVTRNKVAVVIRFVFVQYLLLGLISLFKDYLYDIISLILHCMRRFANKYNQNLYLNSLLSNLCVQFIINFWFLTELEFLIRRKQQNSCEGISSEYNMAIGSRQIQIPFGPSHRSLFLTLESSNDMLVCLRIECSSRFRNFSIIKYLK